jgi:hypothetical protein
VENTGWEGLEWSIFMFGALKLVTPACVDRGPRQLGLVATSIELCTDAYELYGTPETK